MIDTAHAMVKALKKGLFTGVILYQGPSMIDGAPIVAIANRIAVDSNNEKTGAMVQTFIIRSDVAPLIALKTGQDAAVCGDCQHRPANNGTCYVNVAQSVTSVFKAFTRGRYATPGVDYDPAILPDLMAGKVFRLGTYGDPTAAPIAMWQACLRHVKGHAGYTHQWRDARFTAFADIVMASADSAQDMTDAHTAGWRTFRVRHVSEIVEPGEIMCPASEEAGRKTNCASCKACGGNTAKARVSIVIAAHGIQSRKFAAPLHLS